MFEGPGGEGVGFAGVDRHLGHFEVGGVGEGFGGFDEPLVGGVWGVVDFFGSGCPFGDRFAEEEGEKGSSKSDEPCKKKKVWEVELVGLGDLVDSEEGGGGAEDEESGEVSAEE